MIIHEKLKILSNFHENNPDPQKTKIDYYVELRKLFASYFSYSEELMEYIMLMFNPHEAYNFLEMMETQRPMTIRVNTLRTNKKQLA